MRERRRSQVSLGLMLLAVAALAGCSAGNSKDDSGAKELSKQEELKQAREQGARDQRIKQLERDIRQQKKGGTTSGGTAAGGASGGSSSGGGGGRSSCGGGVEVGPNTSCDFARNVQSSFDGSGPGTVDVYSPATGRTYSMTCTSSPHRCTGGNNASVYFP